MNSKDKARLKKQLAPHINAIEQFNDAIKKASRKKTRELTCIELINFESFFDGVSLIANLYNGYAKRDIGTALNDKEYKTLWNEELGYKLITVTFAKKDERLLVRTNEDAVKVISRMRSVSIYYGIAHFQHYVLKSVSEEIDGLLYLLSKAVELPDKMNNKIDSYGSKT